MALESIAVCLVETNKERQAAAARQRAARSLYLARCKALKALEREEAAREAAAAAAAPAPPELAANGGDGTNGGFAASAGPEGAAGTNGHQAAQLHRQASLFKVGGCEVGGGRVWRACGRRGPHPPAPATLSHTLPQTVSLPRTLSTMRATLAADESYCQWLAGTIDLWCAITLFMLYNLAVVLIYTLQSGYVDLLVGWGGPPPPEWL